MSDIQIPLRSKTFVTAAGIGIITCAIIWSVYAIQSGLRTAEALDQLSLATSAMKWVNLGKTLCWLCVCVALGLVGYALLRHKRRLAMISVGICIVFAMATEVLNAIQQQQRAGYQQTLDDLDEQIREFEKETTAE